MHITIQGGGVSRRFPSVRNKVCYEIDKLSIDKSLNTGFGSGGPWPGIDTPCPLIYTSITSTHFPLHRICIVECIDPDVTESAREFRDSDNGWTKILTNQILDGIKLSVMCNPAVGLGESFRRRL